MGFNCHKQATHIGVIKSIYKSLKWQLPADSKTYSKDYGVAPGQAKGLP